MPQITPDPAQSPTRQPVDPHAQLPALGKLTPEERRRLRALRREFERALFVNGDDVGPWAEWLARHTILAERAERRGAA